MLVEKRFNACSVERKTSETCIRIELKNDGEGTFTGSTRMGFFDHMLKTFCKFSTLSLKVESFEVDSQIDLHHGVEDFGIVLGTAFRELLDYSQLARFGYAVVPMDEALIVASIDLSGRPFLNYQVRFETERVGEFPIELFEEFFKSFVSNAKITLHLVQLYGKNSHHIAEACFKSFAIALRSAINESGSIQSTKGMID
ncbi:imidazoleglycerol-phosphate dehydratase HisB [Pseudothermotoga sp.]|nr:imidazoleglycerol-phosphate dehydratase HisB [Pseudothermotoga sp.]MDW8140518.1 imidazoleglycerol-phosphate dehydratase HisB [Pseudothermotoga sp.]